MMRRNPWLVLLGLIVVCNAVGALAGWITIPAIESWYMTLNKPSWNPPNWIFGPVWTVLYVMMAVAAWLVWKTGANVRAAMLMFFLQLALNGTWSVLFFGAQSAALGLMGVTALLLAVAATTGLFWRKWRPAGALMLPYLAWVSFAAFLNFTIWQLN